MVSGGGVVSVCENELEFVTFERWEEEYDYHSKITRIPFFGLFKKWKPFYLWRTRVRAKKIHMAKEALNNNLFIVTQVYNCL